MRVVRWLIAVLALALVPAASAAAAPNTFLDGGPGAVTNDASPAFSFHSDEADAKFECRLDFAVFAACASPFSPAAPLADGRHTFSVRAVDTTGAPDASPAARDFFIDTSPPDTSVSGPGRTVDRTPTFLLGSEAGAVFECSVDGAEFGGCRSPVTLSRLELGGHVLRVRAQDSAGNVDPTPAVRRFAVVLGVRAVGARLQRARTVVVRAACPQETCRLVAGLRVRAGGREFAVRSRVLVARAGRLVTLRLPFGAAARRALALRLGKRSSRLPVVVVVRAQDGAARASARRPVTLRR